MPSQSPYLPITPQEIADEAVRSAEAGAAVVHVHARDPKTGEPSSDPALFEEIMGLHKAKVRRGDLPHHRRQPAHEL